MGETGLSELERTLKALANINRLRLLSALQEPKGYRDLDLSPSRQDDLGSDDRPISRPALRRHLDTLMDLGVVQKEREGRANQFVLDHSRLFAVIEDLRELTAVRPQVEVESDTMALDLEHRSIETENAHLVLVRGVGEGQAFELIGKGAEGEWLIGRDPALDVPLDYDAYVSSEHARLMRREDGYFLADLAKNKNGTFLNWNKLARGGVAEIRSGDIIGVGRSLLVFRRPRE